MGAGGCGWYVVGTAGYLVDAGGCCWVLLGLRLAAAAGFSQSPLHCPQPHVSRPLLHAPMLLRALLLPIVFQLFSFCMLLTLLLLLLLPEEVIVIDEIGTEAECLAARTIAQRGVQLIATAHGEAAGRGRGRAGQGRARCWLLDWQVQLPVLYFPGHMV